MFGDRLVIVFRGEFSLCVPGVCRAYLCAFRQLGNLSTVLGFVGQFHVRIRGVSLLGVHSCA